DPGGRGMRFTPGEQGRGPGGETDAVNILFVEDDADYREALAEELSDHGFTVQCFGGGDAMLAALGASLPADVILLDWSLPGTSGIDLVPQLRQRSVD